MNEQPIVTVVVYTYNSSKYIADTLKSIRNQTYPNLMLIISDDCSNDNTVGICKKWIDKNESRFIKIKLLTSDKNTGISGNANRAWDACETEYFKDIAGDDLLLPNCVQDYVDYIQEHPETVVVFGRVRPFRVYLGIKMWYKESSHDYGFFGLSSEEQYHSLINNGNRLPAASCFYNINKLREMSFKHDERIPLLEDYPKWIVLTKRGVKLVLLDNHTVAYRLNNNSLSVGVYSPNFFKSNILLFLYYFQKDSNSVENNDEEYNLISNHISHLYTNAVNSFEYKLGCFLMRPFRILQTIGQYFKE